MGRATYLGTMKPTPPSVSLPARELATVPVHVRVTATEHAKILHLALTTGTSWSKALRRVIREADVPGIAPDRSTST